MERRRLGANGPEVSSLGLGCFGMAHAYGMAEATESIATIQRALDLGCNFIDTADSYGAGQNESLVGQAIRERREEVFLATKFGFVWDKNGNPMARNGRPSYVYQACEASLRQLGISTIDLFYLHRIDPEVPVEETVGAMGELIAQGKVRHLGLSEASADNLRRAHATHPITALQSEYSLWARDPERDILPICDKLEIGFVAFAPLGRGGLFDRLYEEDLRADDFRRILPRFDESNRACNLELVARLQEIASSKQCSPAQLSLAWLLAKGPNITAIPGTRKTKHLEENLGAVELRLTQAECEQLDILFHPAIFAGQRYSEDSLFKPE